MGRRQRSRPCSTRRCSTKRWNRCATFLRDAWNFWRTEHPIKAKSKGSLTRGYATLEAGACAVDCRTRVRFDGNSAGSLSRLNPSQQGSCASVPYQPGLSDGGQTGTRMPLPECRRIQLPRYRAVPVVPPPGKPELPREQNIVIGKERGKRNSALENCLAKG